MAIVGTCRHWSSPDKSRTRDSSCRGILIKEREDTTVLDFWKNLVAKLKLTAIKLPRDSKLAIKNAEVLENDELLQYTSIEHMAESDVIVPRLTTLSKGYITIVCLSFGSSLNSSPDSVLCTIPILKLENSIAYRLTCTVYAWAPTLQHNPLGKSTF